eukprot:182116-Rhodomonas_salina.1
MKDGGHGVEVAANAEGYASTKLGHLGPRTAFRRQRQTQTAQTMPRGSRVWGVWSGCARAVLTALLDRTCQGNARTQTLLDGDRVRASREVEKGGSGEVEDGGGERREGGFRVQGQGSSRGVWLLVKESGVKQVERRWRGDGAPVLRCDVALGQELRDRGLALLVEVPAHHHCLPRHSKGLNLRTG